MIDAARSFAPRPWVLFVCAENAFLSQIAEAYVWHLGRAKVKAFSAGLRPASRTDSRATEAMLEIGIDLSCYQPKPLAAVPRVEYDLVVTLGCDESGLDVPARHRLHWAFPDPRNKDADELRLLRDHIAARVRALLESFGHRVEPASRTRIPARREPPPEVCAACAGAGT
jgi:protein-tyrosine-phosphatase